MVFARTDRADVERLWTPEVRLGKDADCVVMKLRPLMLGDSAIFCFSKTNKLVSSKAF